MRRATFVIIVALCTLLAACGGTSEVAEFDVVPVEDIATEAASADEQVPADDAPAGSRDREPTAAEEESTQIDESPEDPVEAEAIEEPEAVVLVADPSRRGQVIAVTDPSGVAVQRIQADLGPGETLAYTFEVVAGQSILVRQTGGCVFEGDGLLLADLDGPSGVNGAIFFRSDDECTDSRRYDAAESGTATITASDTDPQFSGTFSFEVVDVTNQPVVELAFGDRVESNSPVDGAGVFEFPGSVDVYSFEVQAGDAYLVRQLGCELVDTTGASFEFSGAASGTAFLNAGRCNDATRREAESTGTVFIHASAGSKNTGTGTYSFELVDLNATDSFELEVGDLVGPDTPAKGAGRIEDPGSRDEYRLQLVAGETVSLIQQGDCEFGDGAGVSMQISGAGVDTTFFFHNGDCLDARRLTAEFDDSVTMLVSEARNEITGTYSFEVASAAETIGEAEEVLDELNAVEVDEERLITLDETVLFDFGSAELKPSANQALVDVVDVLGVYTTGDVRIVGHTDAVGTDADNERLSLRRAEAVVEALVGLGVPSERMIAIGTGESAPVEPNENNDGSDNPEGRAANRRVEIFFNTNG